VHRRRGSAQRRAHQTFDRLDVFHHHRDARRHAQIGEEIVDQAAHHGSLLIQDEAQLTEVGNAQRALACERMALGTAILNSSTQSGSTCRSRSSTG
jgi:hypothetical protein